MGAFQSRMKIQEHLDPGNVHGGAVSPWGSGIGLTPSAFGDEPLYGPPAMHGDLEKGPPLGSAQRLIHETSEQMKDPSYDPEKKVGSLETEKDRFQALNQLNQQQMGDPEAERRCGAYVLLGGAMLSGGEGGILKLLDSVEKFRNKNGGEIEAEKLEETMAGLAALRKKIAGHEELTLGDLNLAASGVYDMMMAKPKGTSRRAAPIRTASASS
jgi:hypothetical protein